eukprot:1699524-Rhodomonas_salina.1
MAGKRQRDAGAALPRCEQGMVPCAGGYYYFLTEWVVAVENEREALRRQGLKPKDHAKENRRMLQDMQRKTAEAKTQPNVSEDQFKMARFKGVQSQVRQQMIEGVKHENIPARPATAPTSYVRKGDGLRRRPTTPNLESHESPRPKTSSKPRVPTREECRMQEEMLR